MFPTTRTIVGAGVGWLRMAVWDTLGDILILLIAAVLLGMLVVLLGIVAGLREPGG